MRRAAILLVLLATLLVPVRGAPGEPALAVIVHPDRTARLDVEDVARIYLRQRRFWDDGEPIVPLNRETETATREAFSRRVLRGGSAGLQEYWNVQYFHGIFPPLVLGSAEAVKRYVASERNAIGYVEWSEVDDTVRVALKLE